MRLARATLSICVLLSVAGTAAADPRWWWDDLNVSSSPADSFTPDLAISGGDPGSGQGSAIYVVWAEVDPLLGDLELWITLTPNQGCSFCPPVRLTDNAVNDANPRIAVGTSPDFHLSLQVIFEREGLVVVAYDSSTIPSFTPPDQVCGLLAQAGANVIARGQYVQLNPVGFQAEQPDIAVANYFSFSHFHAVWRDGPEILAARDLTGSGGAGWLVAPPKRLTAAANPRQPVVDCDLLTDPDPDSGNSTANRSAVNVAYVDATDGRLFALRSIDSGSTFSATGTRPDGPAGPVSNVTNAPTRRPSIDAGASGFSFTEPTWLVTAWDDLRSNPPYVNVDGRHQVSPVTALPDWQANDEVIALTLADDEGGPSITVARAFGADNPAYVAWEDTRSGPRELVYRGGLLAAASLNALDFDRFPILANRALDPTVSLDFQLTHCVFDEPTFGCTPTRVAGDARDVELISDPQNVYAVWSDSRDGQRDIYFKRTDEFTFMNAPRLATRCTSLTTAAIDVTFDTVPSCPASFAYERMLRYRIYHGTTRGGPYLDAASPIEVIHDPALGSVVTRTIDGLTPGQLYFVIVVPEDQARNLLPSDFDPTRTAPIAPFNERSARTPDPCRPVLVPSCAIASDRCPSDGALGDGNIDFGELIDVEITIRNSGSAPAANYSALLQVIGAAVVSPPGGVIAIDEIPAGGAVVVRAMVQLPRPADGASCRDSVALTLTNQASDGILTYADAPLPACSPRLGDPSGTCRECPTFPEVFVLRCEVVADSCRHGGTGNGDEVVDPDEDVQLEVEFVNGGELPANGFLALLQVDGASITSGADVGPVTLAPGGSHVHAARLAVSAACGEIVDVDVIQLTSDAGFYSYPDATACDHRVGANPASALKVYSEDAFLTIPDGGQVTTPQGLDPVEARLVESAVLRVEGQFSNLPNLAATLLGPGGTLDATTVLVGPLNVTAFYNGPFEGPGHYDMRFEELAPDATISFVQEWSLTIRDTEADCTPCVAPLPPDVRATCRIVSDRCPDDPLLDGDGQLDFGELIDMEILLENVGDIAATNYAAVLNATGATIVVPTGGNVAAASIAARSTLAIPVTIRLPLSASGALCADPVDLTLSGQTADGPLTFPDTPLVGCDFLLGHPDWACSECIAPFQVCLYRSDVTSLFPHVPDPTAVYLVPRSPDDIALQGTGYACPFTTGTLEPDGNALGSGVALSLYQVNLLTDSLRVSKSGTTLRFAF